LVERRLWALPQLLLPSPALVVLAVDMQDPGNVGAMIRSAEAGGATGVVVAGRSADPWSWKALRAAMGSTLRVPVMTIPEAPSAVESIRAAHATAVACVVRNAKCMHDVDLRQPVVLIIGGEGAGLPDRLVAAADDRVSIPMSGQVNSLNAAVASALLVYEARRQRAERM
jgi:TrmH family RNA methyltransferase